MIVTRSNQVGSQPRALQGGAAVFVFALLAGVLMLPRLQSPQLGLLDDGVVLRLAESMKENWSVAIELMRNTGRFMPGYWLFYGMRHVLFGVHPLPLFLVNWLVLLVTTLCLVRFVRLAGVPPRASFLSGLLFLLSGPVIENFYTLSKSEVPLTLWLAGGLPLVVVSTLRGGRGWWNAARVGLLFLCVLLACLTKETSVVLVPIAASWFLLDRLRSHFGKSESTSPGYGLYLVASVLSVGILLGLRWYFALPSLAEGGYTGAYRPSVGTILVSLNRWTLFGGRDFAYLLPLFLCAPLWLRGADERVAHLLWNMGLWMAGWVSIFLPWPSLLEYHLLPFALGACPVGGVLLDGLLTWYRTQRAAWSRLIWAAGSLTATIVLMAVTVLNNASNARVQLAIDAANDRLLDFLATLPPAAQVFVNLPDPNEYVYEIQVHLHDLRKRSDLTVSHFAAQQASEAPEAPSQMLRASSSPSYYVSPRMLNQPVPSVRLAFWEDGARQWQSALEAALTSPPRNVAYITQQTRLLDLDVRLLACRAVEQVTGDELCVTRRGVSENRRLIYGWNVYEGK